MKIDKCDTCNKPLTDETNYNGWCKPCYTIELNKYNKFCLEQDGIDTNMLSQDEINLSF